MTPMQAAAAGRARPNRTPAAARAATLALGALLGLGLGALALPAAAVSIPAFEASCSASGSTRADGGASDGFAGGCSGLATSSGTVYVDAEEGRRFSFSQGALAGASASAGGGALHAFANARASSDPKAYVYTNSDGETQQVDDVYLATATGIASANWRDTITVNTAPGVYTRNVILNFHFQLSGSAGVSGAGSAWVNAWLFVDHPRYNDLDLAMQLTDHDLVGGVASLERSLGRFEYSSFTIQGSLVAQADAWAGRQAPGGGYVAWSEATANAANTAGFWIEVMTPGVTLSSASGHDYSSLPVPEPASWLMLAGGLAGVLAAARRRQQPAA